MTTRPLLPIDRALTDKRLIGASLDMATRQAWLTTWKAAYGLPLAAQETEIFNVIAGGRNPPTQRVREVWTNVGRRGGKSEEASACAIHAALFVKHKLSRGEVGMVLVIAGSRDQAKVVFGYIRGMLTASATLRKEMVTATANEITLRNGIVIAVHSNSFRTVRGRTLVAAIFDEVAFWRDESSAYPDVEMYRAVLPSLATTDGILIGISTPYRKLGLLWQKHRDHYGHDDDAVLVVQGPTTVFNPTLAPAVIAAQRAADPTAAVAEWDAQFRDDLASFLEDAAIEAAVEHGRPAELPPRKGVVYYAFTDMSGGGHDASTLCIVHREGDRVIADVMRGRRGPHDPAATAADYAALAKDYRCRAITGDNYAKEWVAGAYRSAGLDYRRAPKTRSELYLEGQVLFARGLISIPDHAQLVRELRLLERRTARSGKDTVDHGVGGSDDHANALFGAMYVAVKAASRPKPPTVLPIFIPRHGAEPAPGKTTTQAYYDWMSGGGSPYWPGSGPKDW
jgi:hypothetical protein